VNENYGLSPSGCSGLILIALIFFVTVSIIVAAGALSDLNNSQASAELARAERIHQEGRADHQASLDWQHEFMLWTAYIQSQKLDLACLLGPVAALLALAAGYALGLALPPSLRGAQRRSNPQSPISNTRSNNPSYPTSGGTDAHNRSR